MKVVQGKVIRFTPEMLRRRESWCRSNAVEHRQKSAVGESGINHLLFAEWLEARATYADLLANAMIARQEQEMPSRYAEGA